MIQVPNYLLHVSTVLLDCLQQTEPIAITPHKAQLVSGSAGIRVGAELLLWPCSIVQDRYLLIVRLESNIIVSTLVLTILPMARVRMFRVVVSGSPLFLLYRQVHQLSQRTLGPRAMAWEIGPVRPIARLPEAHLWRRGFGGTLERNHENHRPCSSGILIL